MKILIWLSCALIYGFIVTGLGSAGIMLGGIPTMFLFGCMIATARYICKIYDDSPKNTQEEPVPSDPIASTHKQNSFEPAPIITTKPVESKTLPPSLPVSLPNPYKNAYTITLIVSACLFLICVVLAIRYYYDTQDLKQTIANRERTIQQLEGDLKAANDDLKYKDNHINIIRNTVNRRSVTAYNEGIYDGYMQGYDAAAKLRGQAKTFDKFDFWEEYEFSQKIKALYREYDE